ncbi:HAMP domain-containing sensor histidine kinase [Clostridium gasigenes]|uniref:HAMP domain-containing sensor histidine kinase n=1 Tax=Clostridium gasigenes TaxID=94869 RepID=UPI001C0DAD71|nr:HAMP domain-containing sensor histidine kinase [Clostridium gasigenes]MBU3105889.1 HAMP domain-containing histidine kinase [Clostridium gasigenes]
MDIKLKNNKNCKIILFFTIIVSIALMLLPLRWENMWLYSGHNKEFYKSEEFNNYINEKFNKIYSEVDTDYIYSDQMEELGDLYAEKNIEYMSVNNETKEIYTNTKYDNIDDFKKEKKGYAEIEGERYKFNLKIDNENFVYENKKNEDWILTIDRKIKGRRIVDRKRTEVKGDDISTYIVLPENPGEYDYLTSIYSKNMVGYNMKIFMIIIGAVGLVMFIFTRFIYKKRGYTGINEENKIYKYYTRIPLELKLVFVTILIFIDNIIRLYVYSDIKWGCENRVFVVPFAMISSIILKTIYITMIYMLIQNKKDKIMIKNSFMYKILKYGTIYIKRIIIATKQIGLVRKIVIIFIIIILINMGIFIMFWGVASIWEASLSVTVIGAISFITFVIYIIFRLSYLNEIMEGVNKIKDGDLNYKIEVKGNDEFTVLAENINDMGSGLENSIEERLKSERMKSELITNVSHDLKTPLTSILNYVDLLKKEDVMPEHLNDYIEILDQKSKRLKVLIEDLFEAAKATSGTVELNIEKIQLNQLLTQSIAEMEGKVTEANLDMKVNFPENKIYINADGKKLFRVFENLISNIVKYSLKGTRVYIDLYTNEEYAYITFKNISAYELSFEVGEITERFKRGDDSRSEEGSGLGLSIAKGLVEIQGGEFVIQTDGDLFKAIVKLGLSKD